MIKNEVKDYMCVYAVAIKLFNIYAKVCKSTYIRTAQGFI
jgi:hypothetical protein